ncbi:SRPBCC family protein [Puia dinghuensis]|uniref:Polyketide cyclase n=1 Tax=Puia dinghuensis TaxID=1792502 RepID=A0A8J2U8A7_9BACT|nr:SRPBCC family protein [Puia dinghuensis]GGA85843.1 hypothetical protein GCM10011511_06120 [Puia dinghuensis]
MIALYIVLGIIALFFIIAAFVGRRWNYEKSILINAPLEKVWNNVSTLQAINRWNPWMERDPNLTVKYSGTDGTPGASFSWDSPVKNVGAGSQTITKILPNAEVDSRIDFIRPFKGQGDAYVILSPERSTTRVSWGIESSSPYPMNILKLFGVIEKNMNRAFSDGLNKLKGLCEN